MNAAIDRDFDAHLERVRDFLRIPSVSASDGDLRSTAAAVCELIEAAGGTRRDRRAGRAAPDRDRRHRRPRPDRPALRHVRRPAAGRGLDARPVRGRGRAAGASTRAAPRTRRRALAGSLLAFAGRRQPVPPGAADGGRGGARQPAAGARSAPSTATSCAPTGRSTSTCTRARTAARRWWPAARACTSSSCGRRRRRRALVADRPGARAGHRPCARDRRPAGRDPGGQRHVDDRRHARRTRAAPSCRAAPAPASTCASTTAATRCSSACALILPDGVELVVKGTYPAATSPLDAPPVQAMARVMERLGTKPQVAAQAPWWGPYYLYGAPFASGGLGRADGAHGPDEWCEVDGLRRFMHMAYDTVEELAAHEAALRGAHLARAARARQARRPRRRHPHRDARGPRLPPADRHRRAARERDLRARGRGERRAGAAVPDPGPRLHAAPPRLPRQRHAALERVRRGAASTRAARSATTASTAS